MRLCSNWTYFPLMWKHQKANKSAVVSIKTVWCRLIASRGSDCNSEEKMELSTQISVWHQGGLPFCCQKIPQIKSYFTRKKFVVWQPLQGKCDSGKCVRIKDFYWNLIGELREVRVYWTEAGAFVSACCSPIAAKTGFLSLTRQQ